MKSSECMPTATANLPTHAIGRLNLGRLECGQINRIKMVDEIGHSVVVVVAFQAATLGNFGPFVGALLASVQIEPTRNQDSGFCISAFTTGLVGGLF